MGLSIESVTTLVELGGNVDWSPDGQWVAYDAPDAENWTQTWLMHSDGSGPTCLTCGNPAAPTPLHLGNPTWHAAQEWLVVQGVEQSFYERFPSDDLDYKQRILNVGVGIGNELWAVSTDGTRFVKLTDTWQESQFAGGILHPHFSHDGRLLAWTQRVSNTPKNLGGAWVIKVADFVLENGLPSLANLRTLHPWSGEGMTEVHSFSPNDASLLYATNGDGQGEHGYDIYSLDLASGRSTQLTDTRLEWDEHAQYSPNGSCIVWISSRNAGSTSSLLKTELWLMSADGRGQAQLTYFNDPASPLHMRDAYGVVPADSAWSPDGTQLLVYVIVNQGEQSAYSMPGRIILLRLGTQK
ncbi:MAG: hypothetical protein HY869_03505 [Chloroflexi bacterium]|nr:hypothetical protein [Chloroflexota bacterium]